MLKFSALFAAYVGALHVFDGPWRNWTRKGENATFDTWTVTHLVWGAIAKHFDLDFKTFVALSVGNELVEYKLRKIQFFGLWGEPETLKNVAVDILANIAGYGAYAYMKK